MKVLIVSRPLMAAVYRQKLSALARRGMEVVAVVPPHWIEEGRRQTLEPGEEDSYRLVVSAPRLNGHFHLHYYPELPAILTRERPDVVHVDEEPYNIATFHALLAARRQHIPALFFTWQNLLRRYPPPFQTLERAAYRWSSAAIAGNREAADVLRRKGYAGEIAVIPQFGVDPETFTPGAPVDSPFRVGFLNRLVEAKAPLLALRAFASLSGDAQLEIVGDGPLRDAVEAEIQGRGLSDRVSLRPRVPSSEVPELIRGLSAVMLPSRTTPSWKEQFGRVLIEAMSCGVPVVGSDSGEIPQVIGDAGLVVPEGDADALAAALDRLMREPALRRELAERGRARVLERFTNEHVAEETCRVYRAVTLSGAWPNA